jgi:light-regulated signal transduction histidine kinase (bacteriophytochrome)
MNDRQAEENRYGGSRGQPIVVLDAVFNGDQDHAPQRTRQRLLAAAEFCVHRATGASQAMETAAAYQPDVVILDWNEADLCRQLKAGPGNIPLVVLLIPSSRTATDLPRCGADLCLPRNLAPALLIEALGSLLRMRSAERELDRSRREMADFSMQIAHDIEGPLRGVVTFAELIGQAHPLSEDERMYLRHVLSSADQVRRLARCFLSYAETKRQPPRLTAVPLRGVVVAAVHALRERIKESAADLHILDPLPSVLGDFSALQQVMQCLVTNALNYRCPNTSLSVVIGAKQGASGEWLISVSDNGIGVAKQYHESIFAPFKRLHGLEIPGAGIGLALCKHIVEAHRGRIWVESEPGCGASFMFTLRAPA